MNKLLEVQQLSKVFKDTEGKELEIGFNPKFFLDALKAIDTTGNGVRVVYKDTEFTVLMAVSKTDFAYVVYEGEEQKEISDYCMKKYILFNDLISKKKKRDHRSRFLMS